MRKPPTLDNLPTEAREWVYWAGGVLAEVGGWLGLVSSSIALASPDLVAPGWLPVASSIALLGSARLHKMAKANITPPAPPTPPIP